MNSITKIKIIGSGGQGVKFFGAVLGEILNAERQNISIVYDYDAAMRGGFISADIVFSGAKIANPLISKADILVKLANAGESENADCILDFTNKEILEKISMENIDAKKMINMVALGTLLKKLNFDVEKIGWQEAFTGVKFLEQNVKAVKFGYLLEI